MDSKRQTASVTKKILADAVMSSGNGITIADARKKDRPLIFVNTGFEKMTGYQADEVLGKNCRFLQGNAKKQPVLNTIRQALKDEVSCNVIVRNYRKDGTLFWNELYISPIFDAAGQATHFIGIQSDVTRRVEAERAQKRLQKELRAQNRELKKLNEHKNALLGMAAHDIRNPLTAILMNTELLSLQGRDAGRNPVQRKAIERIQQQTQLMLDMLSDLLDIAAIESGQLDMNLAPCNLRELIKERIPIYRQVGAAKNIAVNSRGPTHLPEVMADARRIGQVLDNLVSNAVKYSAPGTTVLLKMVCDDDMVRVDVMDQGQGIPKEEIDLLFQPFSTTSVQSTGGESSTGLGLAICHKIIKGHPKGWIGVKSQPAKGSVFSFKLLLA